MSEYEGLKQRVEKLERRNRRFIGLATSTLLGLITCFVVGQVATETSKLETKKVIEADELLIRDKDGKPRIKLGMEASEAGIKILDRNGKVALELSHLETSSTTYHTHLKITTPEGTASLGSEGFDVRLSLRSPVDGEVVKFAIDSTTDSSKTDITSMQSRKENSIDLAVGRASAGLHLGMNGQQRGGWIANSENTMLFLTDTNGKVRGIWDIASGVSAFRLLDGQMKSRLVLGGEEIRDTQSGSLVRRSESSVLLFGEDSKVIFSAP